MVNLVDQWDTNCTFKRTVGFYTLQTDQDHQETDQAIKDPDREYWRETLIDVGRDTVTIGISKKGASSVTGGHISDQNRRLKRVFNGQL